MTEAFGGVGEAALFGMEVELDVADGTVTVLFDEHFGDVLAADLS
jgi:hypothetical protein